MIVDVKRQHIVMQNSDAKMEELCEDNDEIDVFSKEVGCYC